MPEEFQLAGLGWCSFFENHFLELRDAALAPARVVEELKTFYRVRTDCGEFLAGIAGRLRYLAQNRDGLPAVGDWVAVRRSASDGRAQIESILPRRTKLSRKAAGRNSTEQIIATNLDVVFIVSSLNREFNLRRIERYLAAVWESGAHPVVLLNKADLCPEASSLAAEVEAVAVAVPVYPVSALERSGLDAVRRHLGPEMTAAFVGSSGVGKSTIINALAGEGHLAVGAVRPFDDRGRHTTTSRQAVFLPGGGIVIDTPGMREFQLWDSGQGLSQTFEDIETLAKDCRFRDCSHQGEPGCAVEGAISEGRLAPERLENHRRLQAELRFLERKVDPQAAYEEKRKWKQIHRAIRRDRPPKY